MEQERFLDHDEAYVLARRISDGDREAFETLIGLYQKSVFRMAYSFLRNREDSLDLVQEIFMRVFQKIDSFRRGYSLQNWVLQVAKNLCIDAYRKRSRRKSELESARSVDNVPLATNGDHPDRAVVDVQNAVGRCVERLAERQRMVFVLRHYNGYKNEEIAKILDIAPGTVKSLHFKAVRNLKHLLVPHMEAQR